MYEHSTNNNTQLQSPCLINISLSISFSVHPCRTVTCMQFMWKALTTCTFSPLPTIIYVFTTQWHQCSFYAILFLCLFHILVHLTRSLFRNNFLTFSRSFFFLLLLLLSIAPVVKRLNSSLFTSGSHAKLHCNKNETKAPKMAWNANLCTAPLYRIHAYVHGN